MIEELKKKLEVIKKEHVETLKERDKRMQELKQYEERLIFLVGGFNTLNDTINELEKPKVVEDKPKMELITEPIQPS